MNLKPEGYNATIFRGDFFGGLTAGIIALPLALAFGVASGAGAAAGLYGAIALGLFAAVFGGTRSQISGPTGPMTVVTASAIATFSGDLGAVFAVILLAGVFQIVMGFLRVGGLVRFIPYPVISGFMSGIGIIIVLLQMYPILGVPSVGSPLRAILGMPDAMAQTNIQTVLISGATLLIVYFTPRRVSKVLPSPLLALIAVSGAVYSFGLQVPTIGEIPAGLPRLQMPRFSIDKISQMVMLGFTLSLLGAIDSLLTSLVADSLTKQRHSSNRELIGQGIGNMVAALFGGVAGAGATMRTVINIKTGGTSRVSGVIHALFLLAILLGLGPLASHVPLAVLAGILVKVGIDILDYRLLKIVRKAPRLDLSVMIAVLLITVFVDLIVAVAAGVVLSAIFLTIRIARATEIRITDRRSDETREVLEKEIQQSTDYQIRVVDINGPFFFGSTSQVVDQVDRLLGTRVVVFNCSDVPFVDLSASFALEEMMIRLRDSGIVCLLVTGKQNRQRFLSLGMEAIVGADGMFLTLDSALEGARGHIEEL